MKTRIIESKSHNPWFNLAVEEFLKEDLEDNEVCLYLWQNAHTIVMGKHQNPWSEVNVELFEADRGTLARRTTGGGTVYHDLGNMNFTFAMDDKYMDLERQLKVIVQALKKLGIDAKFSGRNDILADGRKFSGNAFSRGKGRYIHHGTIMFDVNMDALGKYLNVSEKKLESKAIKSVKSRVINLKELNPELTVPLLYQNLAEAFEEIYAPASRRYAIDEESAPEKVKELTAYYGSWDWLYGKSPNFDYTVEERFDWGGLTINFVLKDAKIEESKIYSDAMSTIFIDKLIQCFVGVPFEKSALKDALQKLSDENEEFNTMIQDIISWFDRIQL